MDATQHNLHLMNECFNYITQSAVFRRLSFPSGSAVFDCERLLVRYQRRPTSLRFFKCTAAKGRFQIAQASEF